MKSIVILMWIYTFLVFFSTFMIIIGGRVLEDRTRNVVLAFALGLVVAAIPCFAAIDLTRLS